MAAFLRRYAKAGVIDGIPLITRGLVDFKSSPTLATGDVKVSKDGGAFANLATLPTVTPSGGTSVQVSLTATELTCKRAVIRFVDQTVSKEWEDTEVVVETYGSADAQIVQDLDESGVYASGGGVNQVTITVEDDVSAPVNGALVSIRNSDQTRWVAFGYTNVSGQVIFFLNDGTYYTNINNIPGFEDFVAQSFVVDGTESILYTLNPV